MLQISTFNTAKNGQIKKINTNSSSLAFMSSIFLKDVRPAFTIAFDNVTPVEIYTLLADTFLSIAFLNKLQLSLQIASKYEMRTPVSLKLGMERPLSKCSLKTLPQFFVVKSHFPKELSMKKLPHCPLHPTSSIGGGSPWNSVTKVTVYLAVILTDFFQLFRYMQ